MAYKKTDWLDTLRDAQGNVIQKGTPLNAQALGKIEDGIVQTEQKIDTEITKVTQQLADVDEELSERALNVNWFPSIQSCFDEANSGDKIIFPKGRYTITSQVVVSDKELYIEGNDATIVEGTKLNMPLFLFNRVSNSVIRGLKCEGAENLEEYFGLDANHHSFIKITGSKNVKIENINVLNKSYGVILEACENSVVYDLYCIGFLVTGTIITKGANYSSGVRIIGGHSNTVDKYFCKDMGSGVLCTFNGSKHRILNGHMENMRDNGIYISSGRENFVAFNSVMGIVGSGIKVRGSKHKVISNHIQDTPDMGISVTGDGTTLDSLGYNGYGTIVEGNTIENTGRIGINVAFQDDFYPRDCKVSNNLLVNCGSVGYPSIRVARGMGHNVSNNTIDGSSEADFGIYVIGVETDMAKNIKIIANTIRNGKTAIRLTYVRNSIIEGNDFETMSSNLGIEGRYVVNSDILYNNFLAGQVVNMGSTTYPNSGNNIIGNRGATCAVGTQNFARDNLPNSSNFLTNISSAPLRIGQKAIVSGVLYESVGTSSSSDWKQISN